MAQNRTKCKNFSAHTRYSLRSAYSSRRPGFLQGNAMTNVFVTNFVLLLCVVSALQSSASAAQTYPNRPIRFIVPFPPGGGNDIVGRIIAQRLAESLKQSVVVDNRGGAGGTIGTDMTAKAPADGYTMLINNISLAVNATLVPKLPYNTQRDLLMVSIIGRQPNILV